jgi:hypothetical protein
MEQNTAQRIDIFDNQHNSAPVDDSSPDAETTGYARALRTLGLILEQHGFSMFDLRVEDGTCVVDGIVGRRTLRQSSLLEKIRDLFAGSVQASRNGGEAVNVMLKFTMAEIAAMESQVQKQRQQTSKMPDPYGLSPILRGVGCYLDTRIGSQLIGVTMKDCWVTMAYRTHDGRVERAQQDFEYFYNYAVKMYLRRSSRDKGPPLSDPTLIVTWEARQQTHKLSQLSK